MIYNNFRNEQERRNTSRWCINQQAKIRIGDGSCFVDCCIKDVNLKGAQIYVGMRLPRDEFIAIQLQVLPSYVLHAQVWVVWEKALLPGHTYGLYFSKIEESDKEILYQHLKGAIAPHAGSMDAVTKTEGGDTLTMRGQTSEDNRIFERFSSNMSLRFLNGVTSQEGRAQVCDISAKGLGVLIRENSLPVNTPLELWLEIPDTGEPLYSRGEVVWSHETGTNEFRAGINLERADLMGLSRVLRSSE